MSDTSILDEGQAMLEYLALQSDPVLKGEGIPHCSDRSGEDGQRVLVIPGLLGNDLYLVTVRAWLNRIGYRSISSDILLNVGCPKRIADDLTERMELELGHDSDPIAIVGHSLSLIHI